MPNGFTIKIDGMTFTVLLTVAYRGVYNRFKPKVYRDTVIHGFHDELWHTYSLSNLNPYHRLEHGMYYLRVQDIAIRQSLCSERNVRNDT